MGGVAGIRAVVLFSTTYFGEISIFGLSKDQTFRIWSTLMNPEQFLILVTYLLKFKILFYLMPSLICILHIANFWTIYENWKCKFMLIDEKRPISIKNCILHRSQF